MRAGGADIFYKPGHQCIVRAIDALHTESHPLDQLTLTQHLIDAGTLEQAGVGAAIAALSGGMDASANILCHIEILREKAARRKLAEHCIVTIDRACDGGVPFANVIGSLRDGLEESLELSGKKEFNLKAQIRDWVSLQDGFFSVTDCYRDFNLVTERDKNTCRVTLFRLVEEGIITRHGDRRGSYRRIEADCAPVNWLDAPQTPLDLRFPLGIEELAVVMPGNIMVVAGVSNAGKTAFLMNFAKMNMRARKVHYFSSEMGAEEFKLRVREHDDLPIAEWKRMEFYEHSGNYADVIRPDDINIIDFLELHEDFWKVGGLISDIHQKLNRGCAFIAIQKNPGAEHGLGGARSIEKARLYLALEPGKCIIRKAKIFRKKDTNPNGLTLQFKIAAGARFIPEGLWRRE
jgi:hypothetical protein